MKTQVSPLSARDRILQTALDLFYRQGIRATGVDKVIAGSGVTKVTFYRHFPSKYDLLRAFLECRHEQWMNWFSDALVRHGARKGRMASTIVAVMREWFESETFRGCAFINSVAEFGRSQPDVVDLSRRHKQAMTDAIACFLLPSRWRLEHATAMAVAIDGAIARAQYDPTPEAALKALARLLRGLEAR